MWTASVISLLLAVFSPTSALYKLCVLPRTLSYYSADQICQNLEHTEFRCVIAVDRLDCMRKINSREADLAVFEAEDVLVAADDTHLSDIHITHKIHASDDKIWEFAVVALISNKAKINKLSDLKGKRLCHPGNNPYSTSYDWSEVFSLYFENRVAPQLCDEELSVEENRVKGLAQFFGESCKPGTWAADPEVDRELKSKYKSLCGLCDVPSVCSQRDKYWGRQGALYCLSDCLGDIAWSMLKDARVHFNSKDISLCSDVSLLCPDGSIMPFNSTNPCVWITRPVPVIAAKRSKADDIQQAIKEALSMADTPDDFVRLLESSRFLPPVPVKPTLIPNDYLSKAPGYLSANSMSVCGQGSRSVKLCVGALQDKVKCEWLAAVSRVYGLQPAISCVYGANCLVSVANGSADATIANTDMLLQAMRDHDLKPALVQMPIQLKKARTVSAVVKSSSKIKTFADLKGKKACFPSIDGLGWTSFLMHMHETNSISNDCPYTKALSKFFSEICISEPNEEESSYSNIKICSGDYNEKWYDKGEEQLAYDNEALAFQCLAVGGGDVAFINTNSIPKYLEDMKSNPEGEGLTMDSFRTICDGNLADKDCHLGWSSYSQVLVRNKISPLREEDVRSFFTGINNLFGHYNSPSTRTFGLFSESNSLFDIVDIPDPSVIQNQRLEEIEDFLKKAENRPKNYETTLKSVIKCTPSSASLTSQPLILCLVLCSLLSVFKS